MEIISSLTAGLLLGISAGFAPGPMLALVITQTLKHNLKEGIKVAVTPLLTDFPIILLSLFVVAQVSDFNMVLGIISVMGGIYIFYLGIECVRTEPVKFETSDETPHSVRKGMLINMLNPHPYMFWITVGSPLILKFNSLNSLAPAIFVFNFYLLLVGSKVLLALFTSKSRTFLTGKGYLYLMRILGMVLFLFAIYFFRDAAKFLEII